ncbi:MAG: DUF5687 family protein [Candidatus Azobacteroides sp.]|nr:DUF5687 family protein [Candidatus Azobacteroides sp.]
MKIRTLFLLNWKSFVRNPLVEQEVTIRFVIGVSVISLFSLLYILGLFLGQWATVLFSDEASPLKIFVYSALLLLAVDFVLKFLFKKCDNSQYTNFLRFYNSRKSITIYIALMELVNFWNYYLLIFFFSYLKNIIYPNYGLLTGITLLFALYLTQILISYRIRKIKSNRAEIKFISGFSLNLFPESILSNYLLLNVKMMIRSPRLRQQLFVYLLSAAAYLYFIQNKMLADSFLIQLVFTSFFFASFPMLFNQFLFSAEASFFDYLMISPNFNKILTAKFILYLPIQVFSFLVLLIVLPFTWEAFIKLTAILFYNIGVITLLSFCCILFANTKMDLFGSFYKLLANTQSLQALIVLFVFTLSISLVILITLLFSSHVAICFMMISGGIFILFNRSWFNYLYKCFYPNKYEKMEIFRI